MTTTKDFDRILAAVDDSTHALHALEVAARLAVATGATLGVVHAVDVRSAILPEVGIASEHILASLRDAGQAILEQARARVASVSPALASATDFVRVEGVVPDEVVAHARLWNASLIVVGTHGRTGLARLLMGSTAEQILRHAKIPVLAVPINPHADQST